jgi:hypothetical protein
LLNFDPCVGRRVQSPLSALLNGEMFTAPLAAADIGSDRYGKECSWDLGRVQKFPDLYLSSLRDEKIKLSLLLIQLNAS